ncbi:MAG: cellulase family glycosylhydrolase [Verrucomicrobia bacterium]|nr:cellulase family glycosylhydrolase [Verrucomicrobiota bacterium]
MTPRRFALILLVVSEAVLCGCRSAAKSGPSAAVISVGWLERIVVEPDGRGFISEQSKRPFHPWGMNYGNAGRLMEDFWDRDWDTLADDFRELKTLGANVVRVHLQFGKFMNAPEVPSAEALRRFRRLLRLAERTGLYLDVTGLACYRPADVPAWYDALDEPARWAAQAKFWQVIAGIGAASPAVFCYDLMNEPISPAQRREPGRWRSGNLFGGYDFVQYIALDPTGRTREEIVRQWIQKMSEAIRKHDRRALITVGLLPWSRQWRHLSGFVPEKLAAQLDFISVHIYPDKNRPGEAMESLRQCRTDKPVVIEETFPLSCDATQLETFLRASREIACGWLGHYDGDPIEELDDVELAGKLSLAQSVYRQWLQMFVRLKSEFAPE